MHRVLNFIQRGWQNYSLETKSLQFWIAVSLPFVVLAFQMTFLNFMQPYTWFLFFPTVFLSTHLGGNFSGVISTFTSASLVWLLLIPPQLSAVKTEGRYYFSGLVFIVTGVLYTCLQNRLRRTEKLRHLAERDLKRREAQMETAQQVGSFGSWYLDLRRNKAHWSDEVYRILGLVPQESLLAESESIMNYVHPDDREHVRQAFQEAVSVGGSYVIDHRIVRPDQTERYIHSVGKAVLGKNGKPVEVIGTMHDVTAEKKAEVILRDSEFKFRGLLESAYDSILILDAKGTIEFANRRVKTCLGYEPQELVGQSIDILLPEHIQAFHQHEWETFVSSPGSTYMGGNLEMNARKKDGANVPVDISLAPFEAPTGTIFTAFIKDVTDQRRAADQQRFLSETTHILSETVNYQERIQRIAESIVPHMADWCTVHIAEPDGLKLKASAAIPEIDAKRVWELAGSKSLHRDEGSFSIGAVVKLGRSNFIEKITDEVLYQIADGDDDCFSHLKALNMQSLMSVPMKVRGRTVGAISFARCKPKVYSQKDLELAQMIADRAALAVDNARLYQDAQRSLRLREEILAVVSHDLKNPLNVIRGFNELIIDSLQSEGSSAADIAAASAIARSVKQMERLIRDLLDLSKIELGNLAIEAKPCSVPKLILDGVELVKNMADKKKIQIHVDTQPNLPFVLCDADRIGQVMGNILSNAVKFLPNGGFVRVQSHLTPSGVEFSISDNGPGIACEDLPKVFDRYWQAKKTARMGSGLGLSIAKGIVENHRGKIWVESKVGIGTIFYFTLPAVGDLAAEKSPALEIQPEQNVLH
jgi:PAS domain S-box-containing protein